MNFIHSRLFFVVVCGVGFVGLIVGAGYFRSPKPTTVKTMDGPQGRPAYSQSELEELKPWLARDSNNDRSIRERSRKNIVTWVKKIEDDWWKICEMNGHGGLVGAFGYYFEQRIMQQNFYAGMWGEAGKRYITNEWSTSEDERVVQLMRDAHAKGYFRIDEFSQWKRERAALVLGVGPPPRKSCLP